MKQTDEKELLKSKKLLLKLKKEMEDIENEIKHQKILNLKIAITRALKINNLRIKQFAPYTIVFILMTGGCKKITGGYPFLLDAQHKKTSHTMTLMDSNGEVEELQQYKKFKNEENIVKIYNKWQKKGNEYRRIVETYIVDSDSLEKIKKEITNETFNIKELLDTKIQRIEETKEKITAEDLNKPSLTEARIYTEDKEDYIMKKETVLEDIGVTLLYLYILNMSEFGLLMYREINAQESYREKIKRIKIENEYIDKENNIKKLEIRKENYNRLTR